MTLSGVRFHTGGEFGFIKVKGNEVHPGIDNDCEIENGPTFTLTRIAAWDASCE